MHIIPRAFSCHVPCHAFFDLWTVLVCTTAIKINRRWFESSNKQYNQPVQRCIAAAYSTESPVALPLSQNEVSASPPEPYETATRSTTNLSAIYSLAQTIQNRLMAAIRDGVAIHCDLAGKSEISERLKNLRNLEILKKNLKISKKSEIWKSQYFVFEKIWTYENLEDFENKSENLVIW